MLERVRAELREQRQRDSAEFVDREMRNRRLRTLRQQNANTVAGPDAENRQRIGALIRQASEVIKGKPHDRPIRRLIDEREPATAVGMTVACHRPDIEMLGQLPPEAVVYLIIARAKLQHLFLHRSLAGTHRAYDIGPSEFFAVYTF